MVITLGGCGAEKKGFVWDEFQMGNGKSLKDLLRCGEIELAENP